MDRIGSRASGARRSQGNGSKKRRSSQIGSVSSAGPETGSPSLRSSMQSSNLPGGSSPNTRQSLRHSKVHTADSNKGSRKSSIRHSVVRKSKARSSVTSKRSSATQSEEQQPAHYSGLHRSLQVPSPTGSVVRESISSRRSSANRFVQELLSTLLNNAVGSPEDPQGLPARTTGSSRVVPTESTTIPSSPRRMRSSMSLPSARCRTSGVSESGAFFTSEPYQSDFLDALTLLAAPSRHTQVSYTPINTTCDMCGPCQSATRGSTSSPSVSYRMPSCSSGCSVSNATQPCRNRNGMRVSSSFPTTFCRSTCHASTYSNSCSSCPFARDSTCHSCTSDASRHCSSSTNTANEQPSPYPANDYISVWNTCGRSTPFSLTSVPVTPATPQNALNDPASTRNAPERSPCRLSPITSSDTSEPERRVDEVNDSRATWNMRTKLPSTLSTQSVANPSQSHLSERQSLKKTPKRSSGNISPSRSVQSRMLTRSSLQDRLSATSIRRDSRTGAAEPPYCSENSSQPPVLEMWSSVLDWPPRGVRVPSFSVSCQTERTDAVSCQTDKIRPLSVSCQTVQVCSRMTQT